MNIAVIAGSTTKFGELWDCSPRDLAKQAVNEVLLTAKIKKSQIDALFVGNMLGGILGNQENIAAFYAEELGLTPKPSIRVEAACASGGMSLQNAINSIKADIYKTVLVLGIEKMTDVGADVAASALMAAGSDEERQAGVTFAGLYALMAKAYMEKYSVNEADLAQVSVKNHLHGSYNKKAQFPFQISVSDVMKSSRIADPLKLFDCSPITDGAAAIIVTSDEALIKKQKSILIAASTVGTDTLALHNRKSLTSLQAAGYAAKNAYKQAQISATDIDIAEVHDCFSIAEIMAMEDLGFSEVGQGAKDIKKGKYTRGKGKLIVNPSGGLKACGHPVGATGIKQVVEIYEQLLGFAGEKQVMPDAKVGLTHNVGGSGAVAVIHIFKKYDYNTS